MDSGIFNVNIDPKLSTQIQSNQMSSFGSKCIIFGLLCLRIYFRHQTTFMMEIQNYKQFIATIYGYKMFKSTHFTGYRPVWISLWQHHIIPCRLLHRTPFQRFMWCNGISRCHCNKCDGYFMDFLLLSNSNEIIVCARVKVISCFRSIKFLMTNKQVVMSSHAYTIHSHSFDSMKSWSIKYSVMDCIDFFMICFVVQWNM